MDPGRNDPRADVTGNEPEKPLEEMREDMEQTRSNLTDKLETLEQKVMGTVETVQETVADTVGAVKETVADTVQTVKRAFDVRHQVEQRPWIMVGGSVAVGFLLGRWIGGPRRTRRHRTSDYRGIRGEGLGFASHGEAPRAEQPVYASYPTPQPPKKSWMSGMFGQFQGEIAALQRAGVGALMGLVRDAAKRAMPALAGQLENVMNSATTKLGGEPVQGPVIHRADDEPVAETYPGSRRM